MVQQRTLPLTLILALAAMNLLTPGCGVLGGSRSSERSASDLTGVPVVIAKREIPRGLPIGPDDIIVRELPAIAVPDQAKVFREAEEVLGRTSKERILPNELIRTERLARRAAGEGLNAIIIPGKLALPLSLPSASCMGGQLVAGNYVDVLAIGVVAEGGPKTGLVFVQGVQVLAVNGALFPTSSAEHRAPSAEGCEVVLEVSVDEATRIGVMAEAGAIRLAMRSDVDITQKEAQAISVEQALTAPVFNTGKVPG